MSRWLRMSKRLPEISIDRPRGFRNAREMVFPDFGPREEFKTLFPFFDPFTFFVQTASPPFADEHNLIMRGELDEAKKCNNARFLRMDSDQRVSYIFAVTSGLHELRHFHEYFGTTAGFARLKMAIKDGHDFNALWNELRQSKQIKLPLAVWSRAPDAPEALKRYMSSRRSYVEWINLFDGSLPLTQFSGRSDADEGMTVYSLGGLTTAIPVVPRNFQRNANGELLHKMIPLGYEALTEGSAFIVQRIATREVFGKSYARQLKSSQMLFVVEDEPFQHYMTVDIFLTKRLGKFFEKFQLALSDISLMAEKPEEFDLALSNPLIPKNPSAVQNWHPGWRLSRATATAKGIGPIYQQQNTDLAEYVDKIAENAGWKTVRNVACQALEEGKAFLNHLDERSEPETFWSAILRAAHNIHLQFMACRTATPDILIEPELYFGSLKFLPAPPVSRWGGSIVFRGLDERDSHAFRTWMFFEYAQRCLLFSTKLPCPLKNYGHSCPGDPLRKPWFRFKSKAWASTDECPFSQFLINFGILDVTVEAALS